MVETQGDSTAGTATADGPPWVLVTGVGGLLGTSIVNALHPAYRTIGIDRKEEDNLPTHVKYEYLPVDLTNETSTAECLAEVRRRTGGRLASCIHLAAYYDFAGEPSPLYESLTVEGTRRLLRLLRAFDHCGQFAFSSSLLVMRPNNTPGPIDESSPMEGKWAYPASKLRAEEVIRSEHGDIPAVTLRIAGVYDEQGHSLPLGQQIDRIEGKDLESYLYPGDSTHGQALVHREDVADLVRRMVDRRAQLDPFEVFLVAEPDVMGYGELQDRLGELIHGDDWPTLRIPKFVAKAGAYAQQKLAELTGGAAPFIKPWMVDLADDHYQADVTKAVTKLGWNPQHRLRDTLPQMVEYLRRDPEGFRKKNYLS